MPPLTFRNRLGELVEVPGIPASRARGDFGRLVDQVSRGKAVAIMRHDAPKAVLVSFADFQALTAAGAANIDAPEHEFDAMLAHDAGAAGPAGAGRRLQCDARATRTRGGQAARGNRDSIKKTRAAADAGLR